MNVSTTYSIEEARIGRGEDRIAVIRRPHRTVFVVADGAGGCVGGAAAAEMICGALNALDADDTDWSGWLTNCDRSLASLSSCGLAAAVVVSVSDTGIVSGASVGDCEAWLFGQGEPIELTENQIRKPLLGTGEARPVTFSGRLTGTLVVASDGLWKYGNVTRFAKAATTRPLSSVTAAMVNGVRLRSGSLQDDVAVVACTLGVAA